MKTYTITLPDEVAEMADRMVAAKKFDDFDHLVAYAVSRVDDEVLGDEHIDKDWLREQLRVAAEQSARGEVAPLDMAEIWAEVEQRLSEEKEAAHAQGHANEAG